MAPFTFKGEATYTSEYTKNLASEAVTLQIKATMGQGLMNSARHAIRRILNPRFLS